MPCTPDTQRERERDDPISEESCGAGSFSGAQLTSFSQKCTVSFSARTTISVALPVMRASVAMRTCTAQQQEGSEAEIHAPCWTVCPTCHSISSLTSLYS